MILSLTPSGFADYELLDSGNFWKLERFGKYILIRPEPQAVWDPAAPMAHWEKQAHVKFIPKSSSSGVWQKLKNMPDQWAITYRFDDGKQLSLRLGLTAFKHVGVFPEQAVNWDFIYHSVKTMRVEQPKFLNLFAYTGGASLAATLAGANTWHLDSIKQVVTWAKTNMELSGLSNIHWVIEDALKFAKRELKRGNTYHGIILDPPAFGHGPNGEKWKLEDNINEMMKMVLQLLNPEKHFLILNAYSLGFSSLILENLVSESTHQAHAEIGELYLPDNSGKKLPLGAFARFVKK